VADLKLDELAELSHRLERVAIAVAADDPDEGRAVGYLAALGCGHRESIALALAYVIRAGNERAIALLQAVLTTNLRQ
jgi:hypothetical protein